MAEAINRFVVEVLVGLGWLTVIGLGVGTFYLLVWLVNRKR